MEPRYTPKTVEQKLGYLVEECGAVLAAIDKAKRWGLDSTNPVLPPDEHKTNRDRLLCEMHDLEVAIGLLREAIS